METGSTGQLASHSLFDSWYRPPFSYVKLHPHTTMDVASSNHAHRWMLSPPNAFTTILHCIDMRIILAVQQHSPSSPITCNPSHFKHGIDVLITTNSAKRDLSQPETAPPLTSSLNLQILQPPVHRGTFRCINLASEMTFLIRQLGSLLYRTPSRAHPTHRTSTEHSAAGTRDPLLTKHEPAHVSKLALMLPSCV